MENRPRLLIIENDESGRERLARIAANPPDEWLGGTGIVGFEVDEGSSAQEGRERFRAARQQGKPHEAVLLDLRLPATPEEVGCTEGEEGHGRDLLKEITGTSDTAVVILTGYPTRQNLIYAIRHGATDFVPKPLANRADERTLFIRLVKAVGVTREAFQKNLRTERLLKYAEQDNREARDRSSRLVAGMAGTISKLVHEASDSLARRYGLDSRRDADNPICQALAGILRTSDAISQAAWTEPDEERKQAGYQKVNVTTLVEEETSRARPCFLHRDVTLGVHLQPNLETQTFEPDLRAMIAELVLGVLEDAPERTEVEFAAARSANGQDIVVSAVRSGAPVPDDVMVALRQCVLLPGELRQRWRSLVFLWSLARNIGVRLGVEGRHGRNQISFLIPVVRL